MLQFDRYPVEQIPEEKLQGILHLIVKLSEYFLRDDVHNALPSVKTDAEGFLYEALYEHADYLGFLQANEKYPVEQQLNPEKE